MHRTRVRSSSLFLTASLVLIGCGGGGGGGSPPPQNARLEGTLTVPNLAAGRGVFREGTEGNDVAHRAQVLGRLAPEQTTRLTGSVGGSDRRDVFRLELPAGTVAAFTASQGTFFELFEHRTGACIAASRATASATLHALETCRVDLVVAARGQQTIDYEVRVDGAAPSAVATAVPALQPAASVASELQLGYLGADHEMVPGEVVVQIDERHVGLAQDDLSALGLEATDPVPGPIQRLRVASPLVSIAQGAAPAASLELQTCLLAHRASQLAGIAAASPNYVYRAYQVQTPNDPLFVRQWHYPAINAPQAWALFNGTPGSASVIVAIVDTGMVLSHPDFAGRLIAGHDLISDPARALDGDGIDPNPDDPGDNLGTGLPSSFHGTHVGGTVGATSNNGVGVAGMDWACSLMPIRVLGRGGSGTLQDIAQGIRYAAGLSNASGTLPARRCDIMNLSLGGPGSASVLQAAVEAANAQGVLLVAAAGNDGSSTDNFPAAYDVCVSVGSTRFDFARASYSNFASTVDVMAPGGDTTVDQNRDGDPDGVLSCLAADGPPIVLGFGFLQGTSMASPHVAGLAALIKAADPSATATEIRTVIESTTFNRGPTSRIVDAFAAVRAAFGTNAPNPILAVQPANLGIPNTVTTGTVGLSNVGNQSIRLDLVTPIGGDIVYQTGSNWITAVTLEGTATATISHTALRVTVDRTGLADGSYDAVVTLRSSTPNVGAVQIPVTLFVGTSQPPNDEVFVLVVDELTFDNLGQTQTNAQAAFTYALQAVPPGRYYLVAGTDRDNDDIIGDEGELFGLWPSNDSPLVLEVSGTIAVISGLNFTLDLQSVQLSHGRKAPRLPPLALRR